MAEIDIKILSMADLYALYLFVSADANKAFGTSSPDARSVIREKQLEIEAELYSRAYGFNPIKEYKVKRGQTKKLDTDNEINTEEKHFVVVKNNNDVGESK